MEQGGDGERGVGYRGLARRRAPWPVVLPSQVWIPRPELARCWPLGHLIYDRNYSSDSTVIAHSHPLCWQGPVLLDVHLSRCSGAVAIPLPSLRVS